MKHTPGPWLYQEKSDAYTHIVRGPSGQYVAGCGQCSNGECEANARLIAAAPQLVEALEHTLEAHGSCDGRGCFCSEVRAAIRSAKGAAMTIDEKIAALEYDVIDLKRMQEIADKLAEEDNEGGEGGAMIIAVKALIGLAVMHYEEEIATLKGPQ